MDVARNASTAGGHAARLGAGLVGLLGLAALALAGCGSEFSGVCNKAKQCTLGNDQDKNAAYDSCVAGAEEQKQVANDYSCGNSYNTYSQCVENSASCVSGQFQTGNCNVQEQAVSACIAAASAEHGSSSNGAGAGTGTGTGTGGGNCSSLSAICSRCSSTYQPSCNAVVSANNAGACSADEPTFQAACP